MSAQASFDFDAPSPPAPTVKHESPRSRLLLKPDEAADVLGIGRSTLYDLLAVGLIDSVQNRQIASYLDGRIGGVRGPADAGAERRRVDERVLESLVSHKGSCYRQRVVAALIGVTEIARMLDVSQQRASQIIDAYDDFPQPAAVIGTRRAWDQHEVERWVEGHPDRRPGRPRRAGGSEGDK
jgi:predicted DNA-binding transcriptional regulator AlpA